MSVIFEAEAIKRINDLLEVRIYIVHPHQFEFYETKSFALQLLWDAVPPNKRDTSPLTKRINVDQISDPVWVVKHENEFIKKIEIIQTVNYPILYEWDEMTKEEQAFFFRDKSKLALAMYKITTTNPSWIETIGVGTKWDSAAGDMSRYQ